MPLTSTGDLIPLETAARLLMISTERMRQLIKDVYIPSPAPGKTTLVGAVQGYIRFRDDDANRRAAKSPRRTGSAMPARSRSSFGWRSAASKCSRAKKLPRPTPSWSHS